jgi:glycosyltransferase involved in cell wall biosynthesis
VTEPKIGVLIVAYNAATTLAKVLDRIPEDFRHRICEVVVSDDASPDSGATYLVGLGYQQRGTNLPLTVIRQERNLGYGGNQKAGYRYAMERGFDIVVLLHGDGQYAPECLGAIVEPIVAGEADAVFGSRMMVEGAARKGGMPLYKYVGNKVLSRTQNKLLGSSLSEFHSGYRAYSVRALAQIPFEENADGFNFDTQIILQLFDASKRIVEVPIPTYYGDEICHVNGIKYAKDILGDTLRYRLGKMGFGRGAIGSVEQPYTFKPSDGSSHSLIIRRLAMEPPSKILDLGCSDGAVAAELRRHGHHVTGVDAMARPGVEERVDHFVQADLEAGIPAEIGTGYDVVVAGDVIEHVRHGERLLVDMARCVRPGGFVLASVPNFAHWYPRARVVTGRFGYDQRGILDATHVRFFTRRTFERAAAHAGFRVRRFEASGLPLDVLAEGDAPGLGRRLVQRADRIGVSMYPSLFGYQLLFELDVPSPVALRIPPAPAEDGSHDEGDDAAEDRRHAEGRARIEAR